MASVDPLAIPICLSWLLTIKLYTIVTVANNNQLENGVYSGLILANTVAMIVAMVKVDNNNC